MNTAELLTALKWNLKMEDEFLDAQAIAARDAQLQLYIDSAIEFMEIEGADFSSKKGQLLIILYAAWLYEHPNAKELPEAIRWNLNNKFLSDHIERSGQ